MTMYYADVVPIIQRNLGRSDEQTNAQIMAQWNFLQKLVAKHVEYEALETLAEPSLSSGAYKYILSDFSLTRLRRIINMNVLDSSTWRPMTRVLPRAWDKYLALQSSPMTGTPYYWSKFGGYIWFDKQLDASTSFRIRYYQYPTPIADLGDTVDLEDSADLLVALVTAHMWAGLEETSNAKTWFNIAQGIMKSHKFQERSIPNMDATSSALAGDTVGTYWADPFFGG